MLGAICPRTHQAHSHPRAFAHAAPDALETPQASFCAYPCARLLRSEPRALYLSGLFKNYYLLNVFANTYRVLLRKLAAFLTLCVRHTCIYNLQAFKPHNKVLMWCYPCPTCWGREDSCTVQHRAAGECWEGPGPALAGACVSAPPPPQSLKGSGVGA